MLYFIKRFWLVLALLAVSSRCVFGFAMLGPVEGWQVISAGFGEPGDDGFPKDLGDGYRFNTRTLYYACDESYAQFFGSNGIVAIDQAFAVFNSLTNLSSYSPGLTEFPLQTSRIQGAAEAINLLDVKSVMMSKIINMLGLGQADRFVWNIHDKFLIAPGACPLDENYVVVQRNFDPINYQYSSFVNGILYTYQIREGCSIQPASPPAPPSAPGTLAIAQPINVDPNDSAHVLQSVADGVDFLYGTSVVFSGRFFTGLTRDDVGGLRYLYATNRINVETVASNVFQVVTNTQQTNINTLNLASFNAQALTNNPTALLALFPNLIITSTNSSFTNVVTTNVSAIVTNREGLAGLAELVLVTNFTTNAQAIFSYTFANLVIYTNFPQSSITTQTTQVIPVPHAQAGLIETNTISTTVVQNVTNGAFYIISLTNACGGFTNIQPQLTNVVAITNFLPIFNPLGITNTNSISASTVTYFTNYILVANPINCLPGAPGLREGVDKINFVRVDFDSILNTNWGPVTNDFTLTGVTNGTAVTQNFRRVVTRPDITISAKDGVNGPGTQFFVVTELPVGGLNFNASVESADGNGPGTIEPSITMLFTKGGGPYYLNGGGAVQTQASAFFNFQWGSFDGSTNDPVVYPSGTSLANLEQLVFFQISTAPLPNFSLSTNNVLAPSTNAYAGVLTASGGSQPYTWALAPGSPGLPPGLSINSTNGQITGITTAKAGTTYDFVVQATDFGSRVTQASLFITIVP